MAAGIPMTAVAVAGANCAALAALESTPLKNLGPRRRAAVDGVAVAVVNRLLPVEPDWLG